jgi:hypothetical protein
MGSSTLTMDPALAYSFCFSKLPELSHEAELSTQPYQASSSSRIPSADEDGERPQCPEASSRPRTQEPDSQGRREVSARAVRPAGAGFNECPTRDASV